MSDTGPKDPLVLVFVKQDTIGIKMWRKLKNIDVNDSKTRLGD